MNDATAKIVAADNAATACNLRTNVQAVWRHVFTIDVIEPNGPNHVYAIWRARRTLRQSLLDMSIKRSIVNEIVNTADWTILDDVRRDGERIATYRFTWCGAAPYV